MTQEQLAEAIGATSGAISQLENGLINYTQPTLEGLAGALRCKPADLLSGPPSPYGGTEAQLRAALIAYGVDRDELDQVVLVTRTYVSADEKAEQSPDEAHTPPANRRRESEPSG